MERISYSLGSLLSIDEVLECAKRLEQVKPEVMWIHETWRMENFSIIATASKANSFSKIASSIINIYSRSTSLITMGASTVDTILSIIHISETTRQRLL